MKIKVYVCYSLFIFMYKPFNTFLFRTPYFPFSAIADFEKMYNSPIFKEMLQISSPDLCESVNKGEDNAKFSAYRYYQRSCTRPTPFGLFAGCSIGTIGSGFTKIQLLKQKEYKRITRLDMNYICALTKQIERDIAIREHLYYFPNSSIYSIGNHLRYVMYHYKKSRRIHQIKQTENTAYIQKVLILSARGALFIELAKALVDNEITIDESTEFIHKLIDAQILVSELEPAVTNVKPLTHLISNLKRLDITSRQTTDNLSEVDTLINSINLQPIGDSVDIYRSIITKIEKTETEVDNKYLFQTDLFKPVEHATVSHIILKEIQKVISFLNKITPPSPQTNLSRFKENFVERYEDREMPLSFVLDNESGIGYADNTSGDISPLLDGLVLPQRASKSNLPQSPIHSIILQKYQQSLQRSIELTDEDLKGIEAGWDDMPPTISVLCEILQDNEQGHLCYIKSVGGMSATSLLGRFCHLDEQILNHTIAITEKEAQMQPDVIFAEIVHLPESRIGNIMLRPILRSYEITYLAKAGVSVDFEIRPDDLYISIRNNRIRLRSKRLNKEIIPRMSNAHNYSGQNPMPIYHFLCDMQHQGERTGLWFQWDNAASKLNYLPRVVYKNCILAQARWTVREKEVNIFTGIKDNNELLLKIKDWQANRNIPNKVLLSDGDNELYIDMNNPLSIRAWLSAVKKRQIFFLEEFLFNSKTAVCYSPEGVFTNEFIFAFYNELPSEKK